MKFKSYYEFLEKVKYITSVIWFKLRWSPTMKISDKMYNVIISLYILILITWSMDHNFWRTCEIKYHKLNNLNWNKISSISLEKKCMLKINSILNTLINVKLCLHILFNQISFLFHLFHLFNVFLFISIQNIMEATVFLCRPSTLM
jgi:hypothetical protein